MATLIRLFLLLYYIKVIVDFRLYYHNNKVFERLSYILLLEVILYTFSLSHLCGFVC